MISTKLFFDGNNIIEYKQLRDKYISLPKLMYHYLYYHNDDISKVKFPKYIEEIEKSKSFVDGLKKIFEISHCSVILDILDRDDDGSDSIIKYIKNIDKEWKNNIK